MGLLASGLVCLAMDLILESFTFPRCRRLDRGVAGLFPTQACNDLLYLPAPCLLVLLTNSLKSERTIRPPARQYNAVWSWKSAIACWITSGIARLTRCKFLEINFVFLILKFQILKSYPCTKTQSHKDIHAIVHSSPHVRVLASWLFMMWNSASLWSFSVSMFRLLHCSHHISGPSYCKVTSVAPQ